MKRKVPQIEKEILCEHFDGLFNEQIQFMMYNTTVIRVKYLKSYPSLCILGSLWLDVSSIELFLLCTFDVKNISTL